MIAIFKTSRQRANNEHDEQFLMLLPAIQRHARFALRNLPAEQREEGIHATVSYTFCAFRRLVDAGKHDLAYATPLARFGVARFWAGRRVCTKLSSGDVFAVENLCSLDSTTVGSNWLAMLADNMTTPVIDQVCFRVDFRAWLRLLNRRDRRLAEFLALGNTPSEAAEWFNISRARVSQLRCELQGSWRAFQEDGT